MPLYAVETIRMLVDREAVQPIDGIYRLVGDVGELSVPDTLQLLLAARLDALPGEARRLVADASVLGGSFSAEALAGISGQRLDSVHEALGALVRREVLAVKADPLSPDRGQYAFVQTMFRQVAYDTLSRRERKARHLAVADHLGRALGDGGEEVSELIATHLLDALDAVPDDPDVSELRQRAVTALTRAGERAERTGALATAWRVYARAAELCEHNGMGGILTGQLRESAAANAYGSGDMAVAIDLYTRAAVAFREGGADRKAALAECKSGRAMAIAGNVTAAREAMQGACAQLESPEDEDTAIAVGELAWLELSNGSSHGEPLILRALDLAQGLGLSPGHIADLLITRGVGHVMKSRVTQAAANYREAYRIAVANGDSPTAARASMNLSDATKFFDPAEAVAHGRDAVARSRRMGNRVFLSTAAGNLMLALTLRDDWRAADELLREAVEADNLGSDGWFSVPATVYSVLRGLPLREELAEANARMTHSEDLQERAIARLVSAYLAKAEGDPQTRYAEAKAALDAGIDVGINHEVNVLSWSLAADAALDNGDIAAAQQLLSWLHERPAGHIPPLLRLESKRIAARVAAATDDPTAGTASEDVINAMRQFGSPYHLAVALLDYAEWAAASDPERARQLADEARQIAQQLGAGSLADRLDRHGLSLVTT
jgi:tetratricopeptide (TPR) repeat protein